MTESEINEILKGYAKDLNEKGGAIASGQGKMTIKAGTEIKVENGALVFEGHNDPFHAAYLILTLQALLVSLLSHSIWKPSSFSISAL